MEKNCSDLDLKQTMPNVKVVSEVLLKTACHKHRNVAPSKKQERDLNIFISIKHDTYIYTSVFPMFAI